MALPANIRVNLAVPFPALVTGSGPITLTKVNGVWTVGFTINAFGSQVPPAANYPSDYLLGFDAVNNQFFKISLTNLLNGAPINLRSFGATGNGVTDDTAAVQAWLNALSAGQVGYAPAGTYKITSAISIAKSKIAIIGDGPYQTVFNYAGASTTADIFTVGDGVSAYTNLYLEGFRVSSSTVMTAGAALHFKGTQRSQYRDLVADGQDGSGNLFHGFWFDGADFVRLDGYEAKGQGDGVRLNGINSLGKADIQLRGGKVGGCAVGLRIGGNFGGFIIDDTDVISNGTNVIIDQTLNATANRELFFGKGVAIDSASSGPGVSIIDPGTGGYVEFDGTWIASSNTHGIQVASGVAFRINITGGTIFNNLQDGINDGTAGTAIFNIAGTKISANGGFGINCANASPKVQLAGAFFESNTSGNLNNVSGTTISTLNPNLGLFSYSGAVSVAAGQIGIAGTVATPGLGANPSGALTLTAGNGLHLIGNGATNDLTLVNKSGGIALQIPTGTQTVQINGAFITNGASTQTNNYTIAATDYAVIFNGAGSITVTLPLASSNGGRWLYLRTIAAQTVVSASSNVVPLVGGAAGTAILAATAGKWAILQSDGTNWQIMAGN